MGQFARELQHWSDSIDIWALTQSLKMSSSSAGVSPMPRFLAGRNPRYYMLSAQRNRRGQIFLDYLRNGRGTTAIGAYSRRVREGFPIAAPYLGPASKSASGLMPSR